MTTVKRQRDMTSAIKLPQNGPAERPTWGDCRPWLGAALSARRGGLMAELGNPPTWRILAGFVAGPAIAAGALAFVLPAYAGLPSVYQRVFATFVMYCVFGAYPTTIIVGVPAYLLLRYKRVKPTFINCALAGACVAALPWLILLVLPSSASFMQAGQHVLIDYGGHKTKWWWINQGWAVSQVAAVGLLGGSAFWFSVTAGRPNRRATAAKGRSSPLASCPKADAGAKRSGLRNYSGPVKLLR
jgi:hypothetical protein